MANINKREVRGCIENVQSIRAQMLDSMEREPKLRRYFEEIIRRDLNPLSSRLDYIESIAD